MGWVPSKPSFNTSGCKLCGCLPPSVANSWFIGPQVRSDQPQLASPDCATANACKGDDITCSNLNAASAPVLALGSLAAVVLSAVATLVL
ncbi:surface antigen-like protein [Leptomonas seymouri]|uniref:Surface antigen-like protein n=1 Tax=Leptomonas seymouri TaxID=5684 RepID=A0A0N1HYZ1_LEPSE|nr:surface antigen-like protein [Leptomonas seymouri]|eukprot:KPI82402.1 surface antigen-like protein [Leptomonas seymouri]